MASAVAALVAALRTLVTQLYLRGIGIWLDHGLRHLLKYLVAVVYLAYLLRKKSRHFEFLQPEKRDDVVSSGAVCAPVEWHQECPRSRKDSEKNEDGVSFYGVNSEGDRLAVTITRLQGHVAELWVAVYASDGACYALPGTATLDRSAGRSFSAAGLRIECLAPNRRWRVAFNGLLRKHYNCGNETVEKSEEHVKFGFIWSAISHTLEMPTELSETLLAECMANMSTANLLQDIKNIAVKMDSYDQAGMMSGEITVAGKTREIHLWGYKVRTQDNISEVPAKQDHHFGFLENGDLYHLVHCTKYGGENGVYYGSIYAPSSVMRPIAFSTINAKNELEGEAGRLHIGSGQVILPVSFREKVPKLIFKTEESSPEVSITAVDLKCNEKQGRGFMISVHRHGARTYHSTDYLKHQVTEDYDTERIAPLVCDIRDPCSKITNLTGGKGASLAVLQSIAVEIKTFSVPRGFIVTTESYKRLASSEEFQALIKKVENAEILGNRVNCEEALKDACISVVGGIENLAMPDDVSEEILQRLSNFDADTRFAVRSSELGEDSEDMSAAGQLRTLLGLRGQDNVIRGLLKCWASQFSFTNVSYKRQRGQPLNVPMAVVVQELVDASAAGVMFTCDPVTGSPSKITVAANYGIGESVVSASAEPDTFVLKRTGMRRPVVESMNIGRKAVYTTLSASGGVVTLSLDEGKDSAACISNDDVERLAFIGVQIEKCYTTPRDIEWATRNGCIFMLQCRPVTTLFRESDCEMIHEFDNGLKSEKEVLCKGNMSEVLPGATSPLGYTFMRVAFDAYSKDICTQLGYAYEMDLTQYQSMWMPVQRYNYFMWLSDGHRKSSDGKSTVDKSLMYSILGRDVSSEVEAGVVRTRPLRKTKIPLQIYYTVKMLLYGTGAVEEVAVEAANLELSTHGMKTAKEIYEYLGCNLHHLRKPAKHLITAFATSSIYNLIIIQILTAAIKDLNSAVFGELSKILQGADVESAGVPRMIQELASMLRESPDKERFLNMSTEEASDWLLKVENKCGEKFRDFIVKHGHRAVKEFDVYTKPWAIDPSSLVKSLKVAARSPQTENKAPLLSWEASTTDYRLTSFQRLILKVVVPRARAAVAAREKAKSALVRVIHQFRLVCHQLALRMVTEGRLPSKDLLFFLTYEDIGILIRTRAPELVLKAQRRQKIHAQIDKERYPTLSIGVPKPVKRTKKQTESDFEVRGSPMSQGVVEGRARVVSTFEEAHLIQNGEILVTTATDTGWTPYFPLLGGVVTEIGGPLSHGAVVAREYGLPCVVGIEGVTSMLASGDYILLDGNTGVVKKTAAKRTED